jgi:hypothetical protein
MTVYMNDRNFLQQAGFSVSSTPERGQGYVILSRSRG